MKVLVKKFWFKLKTTAEYEGDCTLHPVCFFCVTTSNAKRKQSDIVNVRQDIYQ